MHEWPAAAMNALSGRSEMTLYTDPLSASGHCVRIVLAEKDINIDIHYVDADNKPEDLASLNPYDDVLTLTDRDLVLYDMQIIIEYLDERYPHPPLMPVDPVARANNRQVRYRIGRDLYRLVPDLEGRNEVAAANARRVMRDNLTSIAPAFAQLPFFLSEDFSLVDCCLMPLLWRVEHYGVKLPAQAKPLNQYAERMFERPGFKASMSPSERQLRA